MENKNLTNTSLKQTDHNRLVSAIEKLSIHDHLCLIYNTPEEEFAAAIPFIRIGLERKEKCIYIADDNTAETVLKAMREGGIDVDATIKSGALSVISKNESYLKNGYFDPDEMIAFLKATTDVSKKEGYTAMRATGEMPWIFGGDPGVDRLIEYESKLNDFFSKNDCLTLCQYNRQRFSEDLLKKVIYTHPLIVVGNIVCKNFYYVTSTEFLAGKELSVEYLLNNLIDHEKIELELRESETKFATAFHASPDLMSMTRLNDGTILEVNDGYTQLLGYTRDESIGKTTAKLSIWVKPEDRGKFIGTLEKHGEINDFETTLRHKDGRLLTCIDSARIFDLQGEKYVLSVVRDITEQKRAEEENKAHVKFVENIDKISQAVQKTNDLEQVMSNALKVVLSIFDCDRAWLFYPCDPDSPTFRVPMEVTKPEYPGAGILNEDVLMPADMAQNLRETIAADEPVTYVVGTERPVNKVSAEQFGVQSQIMMAIQPRIGKPYVFGLHQCSHARIWTLEEKHLFQVIGQRLADSLTSLLMYRNLLKSKEEYQRIIETANEGIWVIDKEHKTTFVNPHTLNMLGYTGKEMLGRKLDEFVVPEEQADHQRQMQERHEGKVGTYERRFNRKNGEVVWCNISATPLFDEKKQFNGSFSMITDITEHKKAEEEIKQSEQKFRTMFDNANDGVVLADSESKKFHDANKAFCRMLGYGIDEIKTLKVSDIHPEKDLPYVVDQFERQARKEFELTKDIPVKRKDGSVFYADISAAPVMIGEKTYLMGVFRDVTEHKKTMEIIRKHEADLREAQRLSRIGSWEWDATNDVIVWSDEYHYIIGHDPKLPTPNYQERLKAYTGESAKRLDEAVAKTMKTGEPYELELEFLNPKTETKWIIARGEVKFDAQKKIIGLRGTAQDITERKINEKKLFQTIRSLKTISKCNTMLVRAKNEQELLNNICETIIDAGGYKMAWVGFAQNDNEQTVKPMAKAGFTDNYPELSRLTWADTERGHGPTGMAIRTGEISIVKDMQNDPSYALWRELAAQRGYASCVVLPLKIDDHVFGNLDIYATETDAFNQDEIALLSELANDLSYGIKSLRAAEERQKIQEELRKAGAYNRRLIESSLDPMVVIGPDGKITDVNTATIKITGRSAKELINTDFSAYFTNPEKALAGYEKGFKEGIIRNYPLEIKGKNGHLTPVLYNASVYKDENEKVVGVFAATHDISDLKQAESHIKELNELRGKFLNIISHQLRTPLSAINWNLEMLLNGEFGKLDEIQKKFLETTHSASIKITNRIKDLLTAMDIEEGRIPLQTEAVALESVAGAVIQEAKKACALKGLKLKYDSKDGEFPVMQGDAEKLRLIITKLMENAVAYTKDGGNVAVLLSRKKNLVRFEVTDTGVGIPAHEQHRMFERFFRASNASVMQTDAFGLGLYIAKYFVEQHQGQIGFHSVENEGSTFWFEIPVQKD